MKRHRIFILVVALLQLSLAARAAESLSAIFTNVAPATRTAIPRRANIILIVADSLGYGDLSCYGQKKFSTPNLDKLAAEGVRFTNYCADDAGSSTRAALLLGKDSGQLKPQADAGMPLAADEITVAQILNQSGYHTGLIGEWNFGGENTASAPWKKGFDEFAGYFNPADAENYYADYMWRYAPRSIVNPTNNQIENYVGKEMLYPNTGGKQGQYIPDLYTTAAMNFVVNNTPDAHNHYRPFFLLVNYPTPRANAVLAKRTGNGMQVPSDAPFSDEAWPQPEKKRAAMIARLDGDMGKLAEQLQKIGQISNTVVFFTSAGIAKAGGGVDPKFFSSNVASNDLRVPMIVNWPGKIPTGRVSKLRWNAMDFAPTALQIGYAKPAHGMAGISILPTLLGQAGTTTNIPPARIDHAF